LEARLPFGYLPFYVKNASQLFTLDFEQSGQICVRLKEIEERKSLLVEPRMKKSRCVSAALGKFASLGYHSRSWGGCCRKVAKTNTQWWW
jgi:hypothetical protein